MGNVRLSEEAIAIAKKKIEVLTLAQKELESFVQGYACGIGLKEKASLDVNTWEFVIEEVDKK